MTIDQFNLTKFHAGMKVKYLGEVHDIWSVDFDEALIGIKEIEDSDDLQWKRCENCELVK